MQSRSTLSSLAKTAAALAAMTTFAAPAARAAGQPLIEIGASVGGTVVDPWDASNDVVVAGGIDTTVSGELHFLFIDVSAEASYQGLPGLHQNAFEVRADGGLLFLQLQDLYLRTGTGAVTNGEMTRVMAGLGGRFNLPKALGEITASAGVMAMNWQRPGGDQQDALGTYAGGKLALRIWKFQNELRVAYFWVPQVNADVTDVATGGKLVSGWNTGMVASDRLRFEAFKVAGFKMGPELRAQVEDLPDGISWTATLGVGGRFGF